MFAMVSPWLFIEIQGNFGYFRVAEHQRLGLQYLKKSPAASKTSPSWANACLSQLWEGTPKNRKHNQISASTTCFFFIFSLLPTYSERSEIWSGRPQASFLCGDNDSRCSQTTFDTVCKQRQPHRTCMRRTADMILVRFSPKSNLIQACIARWKRKSLNTRLVSALNPC